MGWQPCNRPLGTIGISGIKARPHGLGQGRRAGSEACGPDGARALVELVAIQTPQPQQPLQIVAQIACPRETVVAIEQSGRVDQMLIRRGVGRQQSVDDAAISSVEGMVLLLHRGTGDRWRYVG